MNPAQLSALSLLPTRLVLATTPGLLRAWALGQVVNATVVEVGGDPGEVILQIGNQRLRAQSDHVLVVGERVTMRVQSLGSQPVLVRLSPAAMTTDTPEVQQEALKQRLPRSVPLPMLLSTLQQTGARPEAQTTSTARLPALVHALLQSLPVLEELVQPQALKAAVQTSGLFLESHLAQATDEQLTQTLARDFKAGLLRLADVVTTPAATVPVTFETQPPAATKQALPAATTPVAQATAGQAVTAEADIVVLPTTQRALAEHVRGAVAQIEVNQLRTVSEASQGNNLWVLEIPVREQSGNLSFVKLNIEERQSKQRGEITRQWSLTVSLDVEPLGTMHAKVTLLDEQLHTTLWAERAETAELMRANVDWLHTQLRRSGLDAADIVCLEGQPKAAATMPTTSLIDTTV